MIDVTLLGQRGALRVANVGGSFYDFEAVRLEGTRSERLVEPPDDWGGRAAVAWTTRLAAGERYDASIAEVVDVAAVLDRTYGR